MGSKPRRSRLGWLGIGVAVAALSACASVVGLDDFDIVAGDAGDEAASASSSGDAGTGLPDGAAPASCSDPWKPRYFDPCAIAAPGPAIDVPAMGPLTYDTDIPGFAGDAGIVASTTIDQGGTPAIVISVASLNIPPGGVLRVVGAKPLIIASWSSITISGTIDVSSHQPDPRAGAGANPASCNTTAATAGHDEVDTGGGSGGGGGGGFGGTGGGGGPGDTGKENPGGVGGSAVATPTIVRGGCSGAASGKAGPDPDIQPPSNANTVSPGGAGGGAIGLSAQTSIAVTSTGRVLAGGAGGGGSPLSADTGGGGGGSGGYIGFDAPAITFAPGARIAANGGGGGASAPFASTGAPGGDGTDAMMPAPGGEASSCSDPGAPGGAGPMVDGAPAAQDDEACGGGGGGGSAGYILVFGSSAPIPASFSPAPTLVP